MTKDGRRLDFLFKLVSAPPQATQRPESGLKVIKVRVTTTRGDSIFLEKEGCLSSAELNRVIRRKNCLMAWTDDPDRVTDLSKLILQEAVEVACEEQGRYTSWAHAICDSIRQLSSETHAKAS